MRTFADTTGLEWTVYEIKKQDGSTERWSYLPDEFSDGWLCFESGTRKRRLTPIPARWRACDDEQLVQLLDRALPVNRSRASIDRHPDAD
jgi:hypothetical protein